MVKSGDTAVVPAHFPFLRLPPETRDMVYDYAFNLPRHYATAVWPSPTRDRKSTPGILLVSRRIHAEASEVLYQQHLTIETEGVILQEICARLCKTLISRMRHVTLAMPTWEIEDGYLSRVAGLLYMIWDSSHSIRALTISITDYVVKPEDHETQFPRILAVPSFFAAIGGVTEVKIAGLPVPFEPGRLAQRDCEYHARILSAIVEDLEEPQTREWWYLANRKGPYKRTKDHTEE